MSTGSGQSFRASGKLLISGEYAILDGATGWSIPTRYGQSLQVDDSSKAGLHWKSINHLGEVWFEGEWDLEGRCIGSSDPLIAQRLEGIFCAAREMGAHPFEHHSAIMTMDFPNDWGLGSSSTLLACIAQWLNVDPHLLFDRSLTGSGYDVAVGFLNKALTYQLGENRQRNIGEAPEHLPFEKHLYFVYSGQKMRSEGEVKRYADLDTTLRSQAASQLSRLTAKMMTSTTLPEFASLMKEHESILGTVLERPTANEEWPELEGTIKHLGAWGGDFLLLATESESDLHLLRKFGVDVIIPWNEMVLK